jgi:hypothetical protein
LPPEEADATTLLLLVMVQLAPVGQAYSTHVAAQPEAAHASREVSALGILGK